MEHRAQTMLYTLLAQERYGVEVSSGLLFYTQKDEVVQVPRSNNEVKHLIIARNEIAAYMKLRQNALKSGSSEERFLPPTIDDERTCKRCYSLDSCMLYRKAVENVTDDTSPIADTYALKTGHLTSTQVAFFKEWEHLLTLEEHDIHRFRKELWTMGAAEREAKGRCFSSMTLDTSFTPSAQPNTGARDGRISAFTYKFVRAPGYPTSASLLNGLLDVNDAVTISVEPNLIALAHGYILALTPTEIVVGVDHDLSIEHIRSRPNMQDSSEPVIFWIDRDDLQGGMARIRDNLAQMFYADGDSRRLDLVVDLRKPYFDDPSTFSLPPVKYQRQRSSNSNIS
ncbi:DNA replication endonuclease-helicase Dna2 [Marasmius crinis-equi]|uniref:DNA replication endonuclease-helicase Dna2 n=1 Tax=Marasmius crinis-equi TaxID=585013 RepID=A0ABR3F226_9AGAR